MFPSLIKIKKSTDPELSEATKIKLADCEAETMKHAQLLYSINVADALEKMVDTKPGTEERIQAKDILIEAISNANQYYPF